MQNRLLGGGSIGVHSAMEKKKNSDSLHRLLKIEVHLVNTGMLAWIPSETLNRLLGGGWLGAHSAVTVQFVKYTGMSA